PHTPISTVGWSSGEDQHGKTGQLVFSECVGDDKGRATLVIVGSTRSASPDSHGAQDQSSSGEQQNQLAHGTPPHVDREDRPIRIEGPVTELTVWDGPLRQQLSPFPVICTPPLE